MENYLNFDINSMSLGLNSNMTSETFNENLFTKLQDLMKKTFPDDLEKQRVYKTKAGYNFACPFCRDSATDSKKKRAHFLLEGKWSGRFKCFNCGKSLTIPQFFHELDDDLNLNDLTYMRQNVIADTSKYNAEYSAGVSAQVINSDEAYKWAVPREVLKEKAGLQEISQEATPEAFNYLRNRCQYNNFERYLWQGMSGYVYILNVIGDRVLGMQMRNIMSGYKGPKYITANIERMRQVFYPEDKNVVPEYVSKLSCVFNIFNVDLSKPETKPVLVTEGPFDAFLLPNCIAMSGASKNLDINYPFWYVYDRDDTGKSHAMDMLMKGCKVFMWKKFMEDYGIPDRNPYLPKGDNMKWDVTDIKKYIRDNRISKPLYWSPYFTSSSLDGLYV